MALLCRFNPETVFNQTVQGKRLNRMYMYIYCCVFNVSSRTVFNFSTLFFITLLLFIFVVFRSLVEVRVFVMRVYLFFPRICQLFYSKIQPKPKTCDDDYDNVKRKTHTLRALRGHRAEWPPFRLVFFFVCLLRRSDARMFCNCLINFYTKHDLIID